MVSMISAIQYKQRRGEELTAEERAYEREYHRKYRGRKVSIYPRGETKRRWEQLAEAKGESLSSWAMQQLEVSLTVDPAVVALGKELQSARERISTLDAMLSQALTDKKHMEDQLRMAQADLSDAMRAEIRRYREANP